MSAKNRSGNRKAAGHEPNKDELADERDSVSSAPESGQPLGGRESPPDLEFDGSSEWPTSTHPVPKDEL